MGFEKKIEMEYVYPPGIWRWRDDGPWHEHTEPHTLIEGLKKHVEKCLRVDQQYRELVLATEEQVNCWRLLCRSLPAGERDRCYFCGCHTNKHTKSNDHLWPRSRGGVGTVLSCKNCNRAKGKMTPEEFRYIRYGSSLLEFYAETVTRQSVVRPNSSGQ